MSEEEILAARLKGERSYIYQFLCGSKSGQNFLMEIWAPKNKVQDLLMEFRRNMAFDYDSDKWYDFLRSKGILARFIETDYMAYF